ncbi:MAG: RNA methyltransferase [Pseudomonadota bacterium]
MSNRLETGIRVVLVGTTHPGNIGAAARAMKTMGLQDLALVQPKVYPSAEATVRAAGADNILVDAPVCETLEEGLAGCGLVVGTSARRRSIAWPVLTPEECARKMLEFNGKAAVVFGREHSGLTNVELEQCHYMVQISTNPDFASLNVASAVQVLAYELRKQWESMTPDEIVATQRREEPPADAAHLHDFYLNLEKTLAMLDYAPHRSSRLMRRLHRLFNRAAPTETEINLLHGILAAARDVASKADGENS